MSTATMAGDPPSSSTGFLGLLSFRRHQIVSLEPTPQDELDSLDRFQSHVSACLLSLLNSSSSSSSSSAHFLSLSFLSKLLDSLLSAEDEFRLLLPLLLSRNPSILSKPPSDRLTNELLDRAVKTLDLCNAVSLSLQAMRHSHRQARIAASCLLRSDHLGEAQMSRARRALKKLLSGAFRRSGSSGTSSTGSSSTGSSFSKDASILNSKTLSFSVSKNWSARQQVQAMAAHLAAPRQTAVTDATAGLAMAVYTMSSLLVFVMWVLVSAVPCHDTNNHQTTPPPPPPAAPPKHLQWAAPMAALQERITEEWRRKDKRTAGSNGGLLAEMQAVERNARWLMEWVEEEDNGGGPLIEEERAAEVAARAVELEEACNVLEEGLEPFERQVRAVFHRVVSSRAEVIRYLDDSVRSAKAHSHGHAGLPPMP